MIPKLTASIYLNSAPIVYSFAEGSQSDRCQFLGHTAPSRCADLLASNSVDVALIPAIEYQRIADLAVVRGVCVGARHRVKSVLLVAHKPIDELRTVAVDTSSRTSATLLRIVLERFRSITPKYVPAPPDLSSMLATCDGALIIGDPAMTAHTRGLEVYDMAALWRESTGLPFVFAVWAVRPERVRPDGLDFEAARSEGLSEAPSIASRYARTLGLTAEDLLQYLTSNINYDLDGESLRGLTMFYELAADIEAAPAARPLAFWP